MQTERTVRTDTATIVLFDPESLKDKVDLDADWWTGDGDLDAEETRATLAFVDTGTDGVFQTVVLVDEAMPEDKPLLKVTSLDIPSGVLVFGAGEYLPSEGNDTFPYMGRLELPPGRYDVSVAHAPRTRDYAFLLTSSAAIRS